MSRHVPHVPMKGGQVLMGPQQPRPKVQRHIPDPPPRNTTPATFSDVPVDPELARRLATAGRKAEEWKDRRDELIREAASNGGTLREIAALVGLSNPGVLRVIRRGGEPLEATHIRAMRQGGDKDDPDNIEFLTPEAHARLDRGEPES